MKHRIELDADLFTLIRSLQAAELKRTGQKPDASTIIRQSLEALSQARAGRETSALVVAALLEFGKSQAVNQVGGKPSFTGNPAANDFVIDNPFAFLLGVLFDQQIKAEQAWAAPFELRRRLGHLNLRRLVAEPDAVAAAVKQAPALHRYVDKLPRWVVAAARRVLTQYGGRVESAWADTPTAVELRRRLEEFDGIAQKKAAMAVEILERDLGVPLKNLEGSDIAYDIHVRRVFLRTGLALYDDLDHMVSVARQANVARPGEIDFPAWTVGRNWCRAGVPDCPRCPLNSVCPKLIDRGAGVKAV